MQFVGALPKRSDPVRILARDAERARALLGRKWKSTPETLETKIAAPGYAPRIDARAGLQSEIRRVLDT